MYFSNSLSINDLRKEGGPRRVTRWLSTSYVRLFIFLSADSILSFCQELFLIFLGDLTDQIFRPTGKILR